MIPYFLIPVFLLGLEFIISQNSNDGIATKILKIFSSKIEYDICFYGDSKNQWNINYETLKKEFPSLTFYNFALGGFSFDDISKFYGSNICNCKLNIINLNETTQATNVINSRSSYVFQSLYMFNFLDPLNMINTHRKKYDNIRKEEGLKNGFYSISKRHNGSQKYNDYDVDKIRGKIAQKYQRLQKNIVGKNVIFIIHVDSDIRKTNLYRNFGKEFLLDLHKRYLDNYELIDFRDIELLRHDSLFYDAQHLNKKGSTTFTEIFSDSLRNKRSANYTLR